MPDEGPHQNASTGEIEGAPQDVMETVKKSEGKSMHVKVYAPFHIYFDGIATSISAINETGPFDILPKHHNFMTLLSPCDIIVRTEQGEEKITITRGIMHVKADDVVVFLDV